VVRNGWLEVVAHTDSTFHAASGPTSASCTAGSSAWAAMNSARSGCAHMRRYVGLAAWPGMHVVRLSTVKSVARGSAAVSASQNATVAGAALNASQSTPVRHTMSWMSTMPHVASARLTHCRTVELPIGWKTSKTGLVYVSCARAWLTAAERAAAASRDSAT
jgi:hypothetical protein